MTTRQSRDGSTVTPWPEARPVLFAGILRALLDDGADLQRASAAVARALDLYELVEYGRRVT